ncbi:MAG TPA: hypothetical protein VFS60_07295, partial [Thermoanaerobaculia bacterium]|nr:hypothetical protein [Thermoanaerobaculia bacterium]
GDDVTVGVNDFHQLTKGWHELELLPEPIRWTTDAAEFLIRAGRGEQLFVEAIVWGSGKAERTVHGRVEVSGRELGDLVVNSADGWSRLAFRLPAAMPDGAVRGRIVTDDAWVPADHGVGGDTRRLGIAVRRISVA